MTRKDFHFGPPRQQTIETNNQPLHILIHPSTLSFLQIPIFNRDLDLGIDIEDMSKIMSHRQPLTAHHPNRPTSSYIDEEFISLPVSDAIGNFQVALSMAALIKALNLHSPKGPRRTQTSKRYRRSRRIQGDNSFGSRQERSISSFEHS